MYGALQRRLIKHVCYMPILLSLICLPAVTNQISVSSLVLR